MVICGIFKDGLTCYLLAMVRAPAGTAVVSVMAGGWLYSIYHAQGFVGRTAATAKYIPSQ